jgi:hypothetical protein
LLSVIFRLIEARRNENRLQLPLFEAKSPVAASQCWNSLLCLHQGAPLPSPSPSAHLPVMPVPAAPAAGRSTTGFPGTSALLAPVE